MCAMVLAYVSAIHDISLSPVLMSGAGTSMPGPGQERWVGEGSEEEVGELIIQTTYFSHGAVNTINFSPGFSLDN